MKKIDLLNEISGVPKALDFWVKLLTNFYLEKIKKLIDSGEWWNETGVLDGSEELAYRGTVSYSGDEFLKWVLDTIGMNQTEFVKSKNFNEFPLWKPKLELNLMMMPESIYQKYSKEVEQYEAHVQSPLSSNLKRLGGDRKVLTDLVISVSPILSNTQNVDGFGKYENQIKSILTSTIAHELLHTYQIYRQLVSGKTSSFGKEEALDKIVKTEPISSPSNIFITGGKLGKWKDFLYLIYLHLSFEINARVTETFYILKSKDIPDVETFMNELVKTPTWKQYRMLKSFNAENFINQFNEKDSLNYDDDNPFRLLHDMLNGIYSSPDTLNKLINNWDLMINMYNTTIQGLDEFPEMPDLPKKIKEDPLLFFKFWEKRFHRKAENYRKKLLKLATLVINQ